MKKRHSYTTTLLDMATENTPISLRYSKESFGVEKWIDIDKIKIDFEVQREIQPHHVEKIAANFDPRSFGRVTVTLRPDGYYYCTNGMHRLEALKLLEFKEVPCIVLDLKTLKDEGVNFIHINEQSVQVRSVDKYRIGCNAGVTEWLRVKECVDYIGCKIGTGDDVINCASILYRLINSATLEESIHKNMETLKYSLKILHTLWGINGITQALVQGMFIFVRQHVIINDDTTVESIIEKLSVGPGYYVYIEKSNIMRKSNGGKGRIYSYLAYLFFSQYNSCMRKNKLPMRVAL